MRENTIVVCTPSLVHLPVIVGLVDNDDNLCSQCIASLKSDEYVCLSTVG